MLGRGVSGEPVKAATVEHDGRVGGVVVLSEAAYESLQQDRRLLRILQAAGVHEWEGYLSAINRFAAGGC